MLIAQAEIEGLVLASKNKAFAEYDVAVVW